MKTAERASKGSQSWIEFSNQWFEWTLIDCAEICCWEYFMPLRWFLSYLRLSSLCLCNWISLSQLYFNRIVISSFSSYLCGKVDGKGRPNIVHISKKKSHPVKQSLHSFRVLKKWLCFLALIYCDGTCT